MSKFGGKSEVWNHFKQVVGCDNMCRLLSSALSAALVASFIKRILNRFLQLKQLGIVVENVSYNSPHIKKISGLNQVRAHNYS